MIKMILFSINWIFFTVVIIAIAYGYFVSLRNRILIACVSVVGFIIPFIAELSGLEHVLGSLICLAIMISIAYWDSEGIVRAPLVELKTGFLRAGMMALSVIGTDRMVYHTYFKKTRYRRDGIRVSHCRIPKGYRHEQKIIDGINVELIIPDHPNGKIVYMLPGGGYAGRFTDNKMKYAWYYSEAAKGATTVVLDYNTILDGATFPVPRNEALQIYEWILEQGYHGEDIVLGGDSAGGNLALVLTDYLRKHEMELPKGIVTFSAWTDLSGTSPSYEELRRYDALFGTNNVIRITAHQYIKGTGRTLFDPEISPYFIKDFSGFPPMLMQVGSYEMLQDSTMDIIEKAKADGVDATGEVYIGMYHEFQRCKSFNQQAQEAWENVARFMRRIHFG